MSDSYWSFVLPNGNILQITVCPKSYWDENEGAHHLGNDLGYFMFEASKEYPRTIPAILAKFADWEAAYNTAEMLATLLPAGD